MIAYGTNVVISWLKCIRSNGINPWDHNGRRDEHDNTQATKIDWFSSRHFHAEADFKVLALKNCISWHPNFALSKLRERLCPEKSCWWRYLQLKWLKRVALGWISLRHSVICPFPAVITGQNTDLTCKVELIFRVANLLHLPYGNMTVTSENACRFSLIL